METLDRTETPRPRRRLRASGEHGACDGNDETLEFEEEPESEDATVPEGVPTTTDAGAATSSAGVPEDADRDVEVEVEVDVDSWIDELEETPSERYRRYCQSGMEEVSDPDEWAEIHYGPSSYRTRSRSRSPEGSVVPVAKSMPTPLAAQ